MGQIYVKASRRARAHTRHQRSTIARLFKVRGLLSRAHAQALKNFSKESGYIAERRVINLTKAESNLRVKLTTKFDKAWRFKLDKGLRTGGMKLN